MLQYTDGGLRNVWLVNGYEVRQTPHGEAITINGQNGLTREICRALTRKTGRITGKELRYIRNAGLLASQATLAQMMGMDAQAIARWEKTGKVPQWADKLIRLLYAAHAEGNQPIKKAVERANQVERLIHQKIIVQESGRGWESTIENSDVAVA